MSFQIPLNIRLRDDATLDSFYPGSNCEVLQYIRNMVTAKGEPYLYLWGDKVVGKTHLLQCACNLANSLDKRALYLDCAAEEFSLNALSGLEQMFLVCLDNIDYIVGKQDLEEAVLSLFNTMQLGGAALILTSRFAPKTLNILSPELKTRLNWGVSLPILPLNEEEQVEALRLRAHARGIELSPDVGSFMVKRVDSMRELYQQLERIDEASLAMKRRVTIPFVKEILSI